MDSMQFHAAVLTLRAAVEFSETSGGRSAKRNKAVGGVANSYHLSFRARDIVLDDPADEPLFTRLAKGLGLQVVHEDDHLHIEPVG